MNKNKIPKTCSECENYHEVPYTCHNEKGMESNCKLGFMLGEDMRDQSERFKKERYKWCMLYE